MKLEKQVQLLKDKLVKDKKERIMGDDGVVKRWAAKEQEPYNRNSLKSCEQLIGKIQYNICAEVQILYFTLVMLSDSYLNILQEKLFLPLNS